jgi:hypothetical protein
VGGDGDVFQCIFQHEPEHPGLSTWILSFYRNIFYAVITTPATLAI